LISFSFCKEKERQRRSSAQEDRAHYIWQPKERPRKIEAKVERGIFLSGN